MKLGSPWTRYSKKLIQRIENPRHAGLLTPTGAQERGVRLVIGREGSCREGQLVIFYWFVDAEDGVIAEAKFQVFGPSLLIGAAEIACEWVMRKNYDQARRVNLEILDKQARDAGCDRAFPLEGQIYIQHVVGAIVNAAEGCFDIPIVEAHLPTPLEPIAGEGSLYPGWITLSIEAKVAIVEEVLDREVRPYVALDAGGVDVVEIRRDKEVVIAYQGACTTCFSATGSTLDAIQQVLRTQVDPSIVVIPDPSALFL